MLGSLVFFGFAHIVDKVRTVVVQVPIFFMNGVHDMVENINSCSSHGGFSKSEPFDPSLAIYVPILSGISKEAMDQTLKFVVIETPDCENFSK